MLGIPVQHSASQYQQCHTKRSTDSNKGNSPIARKSGIGSCCGCGGGCDGGDHSRDHGGRCYFFHAFCYSKRRMSVKNRRIRFHELFNRCMGNKRKQHITPAIFLQ